MEGSFAVRDEKDIVIERAMGGPESRGEMRLVGPRLGGLRLKPRFWLLVLGLRSLREIKTGGI
jgi:hypothetical protein